MLVLPISKEQLQRGVNKLLVMCTSIKTIDDYEKNMPFARLLEKQAYIQEDFDTSCKIHEILQDVLEKLKKRR